MLDRSHNNMRTPKSIKVESLAVFVLAASALCVVSIGCEGIKGVPYRAGTAAAKIFESNLAGSKPDNEASRTNRIVIPVLAGDPQAAAYLAFSTVRVDLSEKHGKRLLTAYSEVSPQTQIWRVGLVKNEKEYYHFLTANKVHQLSEVIPLDALALDPALPVPDKIVVTAVNTEGK
jgi:hypothetical protein